MGYWQKAPFERDQLVLFAPTLEGRIPVDHPVRLIDEILDAYDWTEWEAEYHGRRGQPPIHPRVLAAVLLYGLIRRIRSSRQLEYAVSHNIDFIWLVQGRSIDHSTLSGFRTAHRKQLKELYRHINRVALGLGLLRLAEVAVDGTRVLANNNRGKTLTSEKIEALLAELDRQLEEALTECESADVIDELFENGEDSSSRLPPEVADLQARQTQLRELLDQAQQADKARRREGTDPRKNPAQIPTTDPDSRILPNKEGGYAANYTPMAATDTKGGFIVAADVLDANTPEQGDLVSLVDEIDEAYGARPETVLADGVYSTGSNLVELDERGVELLSPIASRQACPDNPAEREDPTQPVAAEDYDKLPVNPQTKKLDKAAFVYREEEDRYYCPQGRPLDYEQTKSETRRGQWISRRVYRSADCGGCPLLGQCKLPTAKKNRSLSRDVHEKRRREHAEKMATDEAGERYKVRFHTAEAPFANLKQVIGLRRFLLRGLEKVRTEWLWGCTAYNLSKLVRGIAALRAADAEMLVATEM
jgi:transposase